MVEGVFMKKHSQKKNFFFIFLSQLCKGYSRKAVFFILVLVFSVFSLFFLLDGPSYLVSTRDPASDAQTRDPASSAQNEESQQRGQQTSKQQAKRGDFHICYFSLNEPTEYHEMKELTQRMNEKNPQCTVSVQEYHPKNKDPEESFKEMMKKSPHCDGLVISGHHTGSFGGKRATGSLGIDFLEDLSCDPQFSKWFENVNALWLQGCRTVDAEKIIPNKSTHDCPDENTADCHTYRLLKKGERSDGANLNKEFSATLDQDNPLSSRYLRMFPQATVFGWNDSAPGENVGSERSIPFHIAQTSKLINDPLTKRSKKKQWDQGKNAVDYVLSMVTLLNGDTADDCSPMVQEAWVNHGNYRINKGIDGWDNINLNAMRAGEEKPISSGKKKEEGWTKQELAEARKANCTLKNSNTKDNEFIKTLNQVLKDPKSLRFSYNTLLERLMNLKESDEKLFNNMVNKMKKSKKLKSFLFDKLQDKQLGIVRKIDYYAFYEKIYGKSNPLQGAILSTVTKGFTELPSSPTAMVNYKNTLLRSLGKHKYLNTKAGIKLLEIAIQDSEPNIQETAIYRLKELGKEVKKYPKETNRILNQGLTSKGQYVREATALTLRKLGGSNHLPLLNKMLQNDKEEEAVKKAVKKAIWNIKQREKNKKS